jgi:amidase
MSAGDPLRAFDGFVRRFTIGGAPSGPLAGTAFVAKDLFDVGGYPTGAGNPDWERTHPVPAKTAPAIERLLAAGAVLVGKSCSDELAFSLDGINIHYGTPLNPRFPDRLPGGSSSGSVSAVAAGLVDFALGTDTSGSIRVPASYCGVYGFRPTHGRIPTDGVVPLAPSFDTVGWLARDTSTLARCGRVLLGAPQSEPGGDAAGFVRLGLLADAFETVDEPYRGALRDAAASMSGAFAEVREVRLGAGGLTAWFDVFHALKQWEAWQAHGAWIRATSPRMADGIRANFERASRVTADERAAALGEREQLRGVLRPHLAPSSALCLPTAWTIAPLKRASAAELATNRGRDLALGSVSGLLGAPQVSIPVVAEGHAIGLSLIAAPGDDLPLLHLVESLSGRSDHLL